MAKPKKQIKNEEVSRGIDWRMVVDGFKLNVNIRRVTSPSDNIDAEIFNQEKHMPRTTVVRVYGNFQDSIGEAYKVEKFEASLVGSKISNGDKDTLYTNYFLCGGEVGVYSINGKTYAILRTERSQLLLDSLGIKIDKILGAENKRSQTTYRDGKEYHSSRQEYHYGRQHMRIVCPSCNKSRGYKNYEIDIASITTYEEAICSICRKKK